MPSLTCNNLLYGQDFILSAYLCTTLKDNASHLASIWLQQMSSSWLQ